MKAKRIKKHKCANTYKNEKEFESKMAVER